MILSDGEIKEYIEEGKMAVVGWDPLYIGPSSLDLHLDKHAKVLPAGTQFNGKLYADKDSFNELFVDMDDWNEITIYPNEFYILSTVERIALPRNVAGFLQGRSSVARMGINIHAAGFFDPGFEGTATLEVTNFTNYPIVLQRGMRICQMVFMKLGKPAQVPYSKKKDSKYHMQSGPVLTKGHKDYENKD